MQKGFGKPLYFSFFGEKSTGRILLKFLFLSLVLYWACMLFAHPVFLVFLSVFLGAALEILDKKDNINIFFKAALLIGINLLFTWIYSHMAAATAPARGFAVDLQVAGALRFNAGKNIGQLMFPEAIFSLAGLMGLAAGNFIRKDYNTKKILALVFLAVFALNFLIMGFAYNYSDFRDATRFPAPNTYSFDALVYLKTFYLMKDGHSFYTAFPAALTRRTGGFTITSFFNVRPPFIFYLWKIAPANGIFIMRLFAAFSILLFFFSYFTTENMLKQPLISLLTPVLLSYLFIYGLYANWFPFHEYWAWFFLGMGLWARGKEFKWAWVICLSLCLMTRELFFVVWGIIFIASAQKKDKEEMKLLGISFIVSAIYYAFHYTMVSRYILPPSTAPGAGFSLRTWLQGGLIPAQNAFGFAGIMIYNSSLFGIFMLAYYIISSMKIFMYRLKFYYPLAALPLIGLSFLVFGLPYTNYWGLIYLPAFAYLVPLAFYEPEA